VKNNKDKREVPKEESMILILFNKYHTALRLFVSSFLANQQDIEDVCQETFLRTYKSSIEYELKKPKSFLFKVAKNLIISDFRKASSKLTDYVEDIDIVNTELDFNNLEHDVLAREKLGIMCEALATLPERCRKVVVMRKVYGMSTKEIAKQLGISVITVSNYITRGMCTYNDAVKEYNENKVDCSNKSRTKSIKSEGDVSNG
jgi:RNA polymerase sigma factor (sigma-70 family)